MLFVVNRDPVIKRKKAVSERVSPEQKKLMDDYQIFTYLKNEKNNHPASFHVTSLRQVPLTQRSQKMNIQTIIEESGKKPKSVDSNQQIKKKKKSYFQIKLERYHKEVEEQQTKRKQEQLTKSKNLLKKDLEDIQKMTNKGVREFEERCNLYSKYYSEELLTPTGVQEDMNLPIYKYSTIENQNKYKVLLRGDPTPQPKFTSEQVFDQYYGDPDKIKLISSQLHKLNIKLIKRPNVQENQLFDAIINNDSFTVNKLLMENKSLINIRNRIQETPLHLACKRNLKEIVELLLRFQADESLKDLWGQTPRQLALKLRHLEILKVLSYL
ncbi:unnamed protein product (macronuclear) [Paramecium tetraurelia]|uniref:Uncharacterized protein n=1 Tax=Paramecium tetraurelia TaxID=5888 RepID=A0DRS8_PARTE|nr:uncharacterized protein GSPATT00019463001 [Paramecium tetraurelia]CAK85745.1 unnamed protein product [Paramecium tetraurelia]|eukprot:XP_001453142.1 hypothetical protein (macronuclear) [Paramecium tetraurelia strain d4-2]